MKPALISFSEKNSIAGLSVPEEFYWVIQEPTPLAGMTLPRSSSLDWSILKKIGFRWVVCLCSENPRYDPAPVQRLVTVELCDLAEESMPKYPEQEEQKIQVIGELVYRKLQDGEGVIVHCAGGRGRTGSVLGVAMRRLGFSAKEVVDFLDAVHRARGKDGWPESPWQQEIVESALDPIS
ncbi:MAG: dual specificity protein phosphatase family protein [Verrucomicrobiales bacterium]|jgi:hypothetical protein|nr:dual specificity protein phosphatase family protein [Verrucomicrobiales bacterium]MBP9225638.1 dual specificity protein phosphatase family protein [Verrucomicrobiales bacterium]HQZ28652.1 tyrosine-protein phosphatase [Verrucomicrobiales bacterium]